MDDLTPMLKKWKYRANDLNVRLIKGLDGKPKIQMRLDLGLLQMELDGRPDGRRPHRYESYLNYFIQKARNHKKINVLEPFRLTPMDCWLLQQEAIQFYHRYLALMRLNDFNRVIRDTLRNLHAFDFVTKYTDDEEIIWSFEQYRPYVLMMNTRANASLSLELDDYNQALKQIQHGIANLNRFYEKYAEQVGDEKVELEILEDWAQELEKQRPVTEREKINKELQRAIKMEEYERAAILRDRLQNLGGKRKKSDL